MCVQEGSRNSRCERVRKGHRGTHCESWRHSITKLFDKSCEVFPMLMTRVTDWKLALADAADRVAQAATVHKVKQLLAQHGRKLGNRTQNWCHSIPMS